MKETYVGERTNNDIKEKIKRAKRQDAVNILVVCGGKSFEHDISILSAQIIAEAELKKYNIFVLYQSIEGNFYLMPKDLQVKEFKALGQGIKVKFVANSPFLYNEKFKKLFSVDVAVLCVHGQNCEDGTLTHLFSLCRIACTNANATSLAVTLDKEFMKDCFVASGFKTTQYVVLKETDICKVKSSLVNLNDCSNLGDIEREDFIQNQPLKKLFDIGFPMIVKPANLGSSIGVCVCENVEQLLSALDVALKYDSKVVCEKMLENFIEINCSAKTVGNTIVASNCEEPIKHSKFLTFSDKYLGEGKGLKLNTKNNRSKCGFEATSQNKCEKNAKRCDYSDNFKENLENIISMTKFISSSPNGISEDAPPFDKVNNAYASVRNLWDKIVSYDNENVNNELKESERLVELSQHSVPQKIIDEIKGETIALYKKFDCDSVIRVDYLVDEKFNVYVNEVNAIPGSLAHYLWDESIEDFVDSLIMQAHKKSKLQEQKNYYYETNL